MDRRGFLWLSLGAAMTRWIPVLPDFLKPGKYVDANFKRWCYPPEVLKLFYSWYSEQDLVEERTYSHHERMPNGKYEPKFILTFRPATNEDKAKFGGGPEGEAARRKAEADHWALEDRGL